jgi:CheY-like chemotaxis protein
VPANGISKGTILVADDNEGIREPLVEMLRLHGYSVIAVADGEQAFLEMCSQPVDLALLDVMMPGRTGFSVCRAIKDRPETRFVPIVLVTGLGKGEDRIQGIEAGADDFLNKPVKKEELLARVRSLVRLKRSTDELENAETVLCSLARSIEAKDPYTEGHCDRLSRYAVSLGERIGLAEEQLVALRRGGIVHDIGKVAVPEYVLLKPGPAGCRRTENHGGTPHGWSADLRAAQELSQRPPHHPFPPRKARWHRLSRSSEGRRNSAHGAHPANRGHLRLAHHRQALPQGALAGEGAANYLGRDAPWMVGRQTSRCVTGTAPGIAHSVLGARGFE